MTAPLSRTHAPRAMTSASSVSDPEVRWIVEFEKTRPCTFRGLLVLSGVILMPSSPATLPSVRMAFPGLLAPVIVTTDGELPTSAEQVTVEVEAVEKAAG